MSVAPRARFAPSPTGPMHLGNARTALLAWLDARAAGATMVLRMEDLDRARIAPGAEARLMVDLRWLGLDWDEGPDVGGPHAPYRQSARVTRYDAAVARLLAAGRAFPCACSRADVARAASAPHAADDEGPRYPGTCALLPEAEVVARAASQGRQPAIRFRGGARRVAFVDRVAGPVEGLVDDFVLRRADGTAAYQLAVVVDDAAMHITEVVRGDDLIASTPRQLALFEALSHPPPRFAHVPLVLSPDGDRLAKRSRPRSVADLRGAGISSEEVVRALAASAGLAPRSARAADLVAGFDLSRVPRTPVVSPLR
jgi:glutamyl-tRNA synthetase